MSSTPATVTQFEPGGLDVAGCKMVTMSVTAAGTGAGGITTTTSVTIPGVKAARTIGTISYPADGVVVVNQPAIANAAACVGARVTADNTVGLIYQSAASVTPAAGTFQFLIVRQGPGSQFPG